MTETEVLALVRENISRLCPYSTARDEYQGSLGVFLDANESPYPTGWNRYPDPRQKALKAAIAPMKGVRDDQIFLGNGSDEAIDLVFRVFCTPGKDNVVAISPSYGMYEVAAAINDISVRSVLLRADDFSLDTEALLNAADSNTKAIFLCSPNNPTGNTIPHAELKKVLDSFHGIVVVDEAYVDFSSDGSLLPLLDEYPQLIVLQTFSKARGMAALRLGMAFGSPCVMRVMSMVKYPYNINASTQRLALEALTRPIDSQVREIVAQRSEVSARLEGYSCVLKVYPSQANFILVKVADPDALYEWLIADRIIVRNRNRVPLCSGCLRITIGLPEENARLYKSIERYEESNIRR